MNQMGKKDFFCLEKKDFLKKFWLSKRKNIPLYPDSMN